MKTIAVITEFNPFHNGHAYFLREARARSLADTVVAVMSGDFVQRGEPAIFDKYVRTKAALLCGADLVFELPVRFSAANAGAFAAGAVSMINAFCAVDELWFGSESGDAALFAALSEVLCTESEGFRRVLSEELTSGRPYPEARANAVLKEYRDQFPAGEEEVRKLLSEPNNILGLEYCIALRRLGSRIVPKTLKRAGCGHDESGLSGPFVSAKALRELILSEGIGAAKPYVPAAAFELYLAYCKDGCALAADDLSLPLRYKLLSCSAEELAEFSGVSPDLAARIANCQNEFRSFSQFADLIKTRNITRTHANRALLHILLDIRSSGGKSGEEPEGPEALTSPRRARLLGMGNRGSFLSAAKENGNLIIDSRSGELFSSNLYEAVKAHKSGSAFTHELERKLIRVISS